MANIKIGPPPKPNRAKFPFAGTAEVQGIKINVENLKGSTREGTDASGKKWKQVMNYHYGEIVRPSTEGVDGDKLDVYLGPSPDSKKVFVVHQNHPEDHPTKPGEYDEDKVMLGFPTADAAKKAYLSQYNDDSFFRSMTEMDIDQFKKVVVENKGEKVAALFTEEQCCKRARREPSAFIRMKLREGGSLKEAYYEGVRQALADIVQEGGRAPLAQGATEPLQPVKNLKKTTEDSERAAGLHRPVRITS